MYLKRNHLLNNELQTRPIKNIGNEELDDFTFNLWKSELLRELPDFWESMDEPTRPRRRFSSSL